MSTTRVRLACRRRIRTRVWVYSGMLALTVVRLPRFILRHGPRPESPRARTARQLPQEGCNEPLMIARRDGRTDPLRTRDSNDGAGRRPGMRGRTDARADHLAPSLAGRY